MKNFFRVFSLTMSICLVSLLLISCGGGSDSVSTNEYLGDLPGISKNYLDKIDAKKVEIKENTDRDKAFKLSKELKILKDEADKTVEDYLANSPITNLPFEQKVEKPFTITDVSVHPTWDTSPSRLQLMVKVTMTEDVSRKMFLYIKAIDKDGNQLTKKNGVLGGALFGKNTYKASQEVELSGSIDKTADLINFEKFVFISKEEYNKTK